MNNKYFKVYCKADMSVDKDHTLYVKAKTVDKAKWRAEVKLKKKNHFFVWVEKCSEVSHEEYLDNVKDYDLQNY